MRMLIDTDAGVDDAQAIMMAFAHPDVSVEAITTCTGNVHVDKVVSNVFAVLDLLGRSAPVYRGAASPLILNWSPEVTVHGEDGLGNWSGRQPTSRRVEPEPAAAALVRLADESPGEYTLVALGPLTNLALAYALDPSFPSKIKKLVFMGGTIRAAGNTEMVTAEWNIFCDPEAAHMTLRAFPYSTMLSWETTLDHPLPWSRFEALLAAETPAARFVRETSSLSVNLMKQYPQFGGYLMPDPLAMAVALAPDLIRRSAEHYVTVELHGSETRGQTVIDYFGRKGQPPNVQIVTELDMDGIGWLFEQILR